MLAAGHAGVGPASGLAVHKPITQAQRSAETLFETKSVVEIREIEARTRQEIAEKSAQLRQRVGDSHRDLIDGTEKIAAISKNCGAVLSNVLAVQQALAALAAGLGGGGTDGGGEAVVRKHSDLHAVGGRVKYILDTTEVVWGSLDASQYTDAARRLLRAELVHAQLLGSFPPELLARFPLLGHQWPAVQKFRGQISEAARATLEGPRALQAGVAADALAALSALEGLDAAAALRQLLAARRTWVAGRLAAAAAAAAAGEGDAATPEAAARALSELSQAVQTTVAQAAALFLPAPAGGAADSAAAATGAGGLTVLQRAAEEAASDASELYFGGAFGLGDGAAAPEAAAWVSRAAAALSALAPLPQSAVAAELRPWVEEVAQGFANAGLLLLGACGDAAALRAAERTVRSAIDSWSPEALAAAAGGAGGAVGEAAAAAPGRAWAAAAEAAMGAPLSVWQALLSEPFLERSKQLLADAVQAAVGSPVPALEAALSEAAAADPPAPVGAVRPPSWPTCDAAAGATTAGALGRGGSLALGLNGGAAGSSLWRPAASLARSLSSAGLAANGSSGFEEGGFRGCVPAILKTFDSLLLDALAAALELMAPADAPEKAAAATTAQPPRSARIGGAAAAAAAAPPLDAARAAALQPFVQERCLEAVLALASDLERRLSASAAAPAAGPAGVAAVEQALLIGRLCSALAGASEALPVALGSPAIWHARLAARAAAAAARGSAGTTAASPLAAAPLGGAQPPAPALSRVSERLSAVAAAAYGAWAAWAARSISAEAAAAYASDSALVATTPPLSWVETVVSVGAGGGGGGFGLPSPGTEGGASVLDDEMRFMLPAGPSPAMLSSLMTACWETVRAGDHAVAPDALQLLAWELQGALIPVLESAADGGSGNSGGNSNNGGAAARGPASEKGLLQLLLDQRFARDVLAGARPVDSSGGSASAAAVAARRQQLAALEQQLQERLDPIDWATYEPHLWANAAACYQRSHVLLGALAQLQRAYPDPSSAKTGAAAAATAAAAPEMNPFGVLPVAPRFPYLPISTPSVAQHLAATRQRSLGPAGTTAAAGAAGNPTPAAAIGGGAAAAAAAAGAASGAAAKSDLAAEYSLADFGASSSAYNSRAAAAAAAAHHEQPAAAGAFEAGGMAGLSAGAGAALGALQARLHGGVLSNAFTGMLGESGAAAAAARDIAQNIQNFGDLLPGGLMSTGLMSTFTKGGGGGSGKR